MLTHVHHRQTPLMLMGGEAQAGTLNSRPRRSASLLAPCCHDGGFTVPRPAIRAAGGEATSDRSGPTQPGKARAYPLPKKS